MYTQQISMSTSTCTNYLVIINFYDYLEKNKLPIKLQLFALVLDIM